MKRFLLKSAFQKHWAKFNCTWHNHSWVKGIQVYLNEEQHPFLSVHYHEIAKTHQHLNFSSKDNKTVSTKLYLHKVSFLKVGNFFLLLRCIHFKTVSHVSYVNHGPFVLNVSFMLRKILIVRYFVLIYITTVKLVYFVSPISSCYIVQDLQLSSNGQETIRQKERGWYTLVWYHRLEKWYDDVLLIIYVYISCNFYIWNVINWSMSISHFRRHCRDI